MNIYDQIKERLMGTGTAKTPYEQGQDAFRNNIAGNANPFPNGSAQHEEWDLGYLHADLQGSGDTS